MFDAVNKIVEMLPVSIRHGLMLIAVGSLLTVGYFKYDIRVDAAEKRIDTLEQQHKDDAKARKELQATVDTLVTNVAVAATASSLTLDDQKRMDDKLDTLLERSR